MNFTKVLLRIRVKSIFSRFIYSNFCYTNDSIISEKHSGIIIALIKYKKIKYRNQDILQTKKKFFIFYKKIDIFLFKTMKNIDLCLAT